MAVALAMVGLGAPGITDQVAVDGIRPASAVAPAKPNIVFILSDDQSLDSLAAMPFFTSKPGGHWFEFTNAFDNTPLCCPSRATLLSGLYPHHHGVLDNHMGSKFDDSSTIATWLQAAGYRTGLAGKYLNEWPFGTPSIPPGWNDWFANIEATSYYNYQMYDNGTVVSYGNAPADYHTDVIARSADQFIRSSAGQPFFYYAAPVAAHAPLVAPPRYANTPVTITRPPNFNEEDVSDKPAWIKALPLMTASQATGMDTKRKQSYRMVVALDDIVRTVYQALSDTGQLDNTVIVFQTDNGFLFGEHRTTLKNCVYEECVRTPLFIRVPWLEGRVEPHVASSIDIAPPSLIWPGFSRRVPSTAPVWLHSCLIHRRAGDRASCSNSQGSPTGRPSGRSATISGSTSS